MITKDQLAGALTRECDISQHLFTKLPPDSYTYQPSPDQRTTLDLLRYLAMCGSVGIHAFATRSWAPWYEAQERLKTMPAEDFPAEMDRQKAEIEAFFAATSEETLRTREAKMPTGQKMPLGAAIVNGPLKWLAAYKLQLFLYAKANGVPNIGTANAWAGIDWNG